LIDALFFFAPYFICFFRYFIAIHCHYFRCFITPVISRHISPFALYAIFFFADTPLTLLRFHFFIYSLQLTDCHFAFALSRH